MPPRSAGNPNMGSRIDASASSSMGDVFQMFSTGNASWGARITNEAERKEGALRVGGLGPEVTEAAIQAFFGKFYRTVKAARKTTTSSAVVTFGYAGERDRALLEMQGRELMGHALQCHKDRETDLLEAPVKKTLRDDEIHAMLVEREAARSRRDYPGADALADRLKQAGVLLERSKITEMKAEASPKSDPLAQYRSHLTSGQLLKQFEAGKATNKVMNVSSDFSSFVIKETGKQVRAFSAKRIPLSNVKSVKAGLGKDHQKRTLLGGLKAAADPTRSFCLRNFKDEDILCVECPSADAAESWVEALRVLLKVSHKWRKWL